MFKNLSNLRKEYLYIDLEVYFYYLIIFAINILPYYKDKKSKAHYLGF